MALEEFVPEASAPRTASAACTQWRSTAGRMARTLFLIDPKQRTRAGIFRTFE